MLGINKSIVKQSSQQREQHIQIAENIQSFLQDTYVADSGMTAEDMCELIRKEFPEFNKQHHVIVAKMVMGRYHRGAFEDYLRILETRKPKTYEDYIAIQAEYEVCLYKQLCKKNRKRYMSSEARRIRQQELDVIMGSFEKVKKEHKKLDSEFDKEVIQNTEEMKEDLLTFIKTMYPDKEDEEMLDDFDDDEGNYLMAIRKLAEQFNDGNEETEEQKAKRAAEELKASKPTRTYTDEERKQSFLAGTSTEAFFNKKKSVQSGPKRKRAKKSKRGKRRR